MKNKEELKQRVLKALEIAKPYLKADGGDVELVEITDDYIVKVRLIGACGSCPLSMMTLRAGIERVIIREAPEIRRVEAVFSY
ncbi:Fe-S cluster biogenesis protein NfuA, 4Fe-4S-binding domain [Candidatus Kryptobacter tengchongensis]|uniref:Fe-S cluster biogenesis protein NfuA, 4Fe-4S-binding domain n=1 Tax=Kryptobacter tengchongensis TaxID=1643429 RepID=A0A916LKE6_KRYT1|nr:NifU family protein [Candidatus Kryptobacter tengchongensis]CUT04249.1 Fe-S cluster biogenesis protein NfuA, 4Fe-4S-binding domain [Candidatus Kryptobacter tengchongensis]CUU03803.1 Fe-S cluster biogenesis protein NfuA, 4Fe-4S-binding domain [Candidatus Kryptobacter tengchongensis]CUU04526.1 Fe-S cluster biogenesis protein NfuA, 4Fe-4S-binding domain [Candidatus Kryptobacter tengchongensis]